MSNINTSSEIALTKIKTLITQNKLLKGNKLPNERLLSDITKTKRAHVRNALLILEKEGLITRKIGNGTFLNQSSIQFIEFKDAGITKKDIQGSSFLKSIEARMSVEPIVCSKVAENITKTEAKKLKNKLDLIKQSKIWLDFKVRTYDFFYCIYLLSNNKYYIHVRTTATVFPWDYYDISFEATGEWKQVSLPFSDFKKSRRFLPTKLNSSRIKSIGLVAYGKDFQAELDLANIELY